MDSPVIKPLSTCNRDRLDLQEHGPHPTKRKKCCFLTCVPVNHKALQCFEQYLMYTCSGLVSKEGQNCTDSWNGCSTPSACCLSRLCPSG